MLDVQPQDDLHLPIDDAHIDAMLLPAERGSAWTLMYPQYRVVVPGPDPIHVPLGFPIGKRDARFAHFVDTWITLKRKDGTLDAAYKTGFSGRMPRRASRTGRSPQRSALGGVTA